MRSRRDEELYDLAGRQHGLVSREQLRRMGFDSGAMGRRIGKGALAVISPRVLQVAGAAVTRRSTLMAGVLDAGGGAVVSDQSAAAVWNVAGFSIKPVHVMAARARVTHAAHDFVIVHKPRKLLDHHWVVIDGTPVTTPTRTLFDLAWNPSISPARVERALDPLWARGRVSNSSLARMLEELAGRGRTGITLMRALIEARGDDYRPPESGAEGRFQQLVRSWGYHDFECQVDVGDEERWIGRVDFIDRVRGLIVEIDPSLHHSSLTDRAHDQRRHAALEAAGFIVLSVTEYDLFHNPSGLQAKLRAALRRPPDNPRQTVFLVPERRVFRAVLFQDIADS